MVKSKLPPGTHVEVTVFDWNGENSPKARQADGDRLTKKINAVPANELIILVGQSHGDTVATIGANGSSRGVDLKISFNAPGIEQPQPGKISAVVNFYNSNDSIASHAGASDLLKSGPSSSPNMVTNPRGYAANIGTGELPIMDSAGHVINPPTIAGVADHSYNRDARIIDQEISPKLGQVLEGFAQSESNRTDPATSTPSGTGDLLIEAGNAYGDHPASIAPAANPPIPTPDPFAFQDPATESLALTSTERPNSPNTAPMSGMIDPAANAAAAKPVPFHGPDKSPERQLSGGRSPIVFPGSDETIQVQSCDSFGEQMAYEIERAKSLANQYNGTVKPGSLPEPKPQMVTIRKSDLWNSCNADYIQNGLYAVLNVFAGRDWARQMARSVSSEDGDRRIWETVARWYQEFISAGRLSEPPEYARARPAFDGKTAAVASSCILSQRFSRGPTLVVAAGHVSTSSGASARRAKNPIPPVVKPQSPESSRASTESDLTELIDLTKSELKKAIARERGSHFLLVATAVVEGLEADPRTDSTQRAIESLLKVIIGQNPVSEELQIYWEDVAQVRRLGKQLSDLKRALDVHRGPNPPASFYGIPFE